jgi:hypothetical protein
MAKFKVGDRVRNKSGFAFSNGDKVVTISHYDDYRPYFKETGTWSSEEELELVKPASPIRTVTRREIVPGVYGVVSVDSVYGREASISMTTICDASDLREAARLFNEIADVLEENEKTDAA